MKYKKVTMDDIAKYLGVTKVSVHKAFNNAQDISAELKKSIFETANQLGYVKTDPLAKKCRQFYYLVPSQFVKSTEQFYLAFYRQLQELLNSRGINLDFYTIKNYFLVENFVNNANRLNKNFGIFIAGTVSEKIIDDLNKTNLPVVCIDNDIITSNISSIYIDTYYAGYILTDYLIKSGHSNICFIIDLSVSSNNNKFFGFRKALLQNNIKFTPNMHINRSLNIMSSFKNLKFPSPMPTAFILDCDLSAFNLMTVLTGLGYDIPNQISVASFDNTKLATETTPTLTSAGLPFQELVNAAYEAMLLKFSSKQISANPIVLRPQIFIRNSIKDLSK